MSHILPSVAHGDNEDQPKANKKKKQKLLTKYLQEKKNTVICNYCINRRKDPCVFYQKLIEITTFRMTHSHQNLIII